jgi:hypothetical protein
MVVLAHFFWVPITQPVVAVGETTLLGPEVVELVVTELLAIQLA